MNTTARTCCLISSLLVPLLALLGDSSLARQAQDYDPGRAGFSIEANGLTVEYRIFGLYLLPGKKVSVRSEVPLELETDHGTATSTADGWDWEAPMFPGLYPLHLSHDGKRIKLNVFVLRSAKQVKNGWLDHYRIGDYVRKPFRGLAAYRAPPGFVEVTEALSQIQVSPHFTLGQFLCKQESEWPKFLVLRPELLIKLERILERLNAAGIVADSLAVMSGYRTPWYNSTIGNRTRLSRHLYGGAADIFVDVSPRDATMDDLNGDGLINKADADYLRDLIEHWAETDGGLRFRGGLASYRANNSHGPFVHIDTRGYRARWGR